MINVKHPVTGDIIIVIYGDLKGDCIEVAYTMLLGHLSTDTWPRPYKAYMHPKIIVIFDAM